ncbi:MAG TPA: hypothetical protein VML57_17275 [Burkholderiales bacterium]|nr:hypothetical protein [Burkholderiales bacterium]
MSIYVFVLLVYGSALFTNYLLILFIEQLIAEEIQKSALVSLWFERAKIGLALLATFAAVSHGIISTIGQIRLDLQILRGTDAE